MKCPSYVEFYKIVPKMLLFHMSKPRNYLDKILLEIEIQLDKRLEKVLLYLAFLGEEGTFRT